MEFFEKTLARTPVTKTINNTTGDETLTDSSNSNIVAVFYKRDQLRDLDKWGQLIQNADAVVLVKPSVTLNVDDKLTYDSETFRVDASVKRFIGGVHFYTAYQCFRVS